MNEKDTANRVSVPAGEHERLQIRALIALTPAERVRMIVESTRNAIELVEHTRKK